jgi:hypothetical protein
MDSLRDGHPLRLKRISPPRFRELEGENDSTSETIGGENETLMPVVDRVGDLDRGTARADCSGGRANRPESKRFAPRGRGETLLRPDIMARDVAHSTLASARVPATTELPKRERLMLVVRSISNLT